MPWDQLSAEQRRTVALQLDYQHDPAAEANRQFWWDHHHHQVDLKAQIAQWQAAAAPTAGELALRETRLKELRQELARTGIAGTTGQGLPTLGSRWDPYGNGHVCTPAKPKTASSPSNKRGFTPSLTKAA